MASIHDVSLDMGMDIPSVTYLVSCILPPTFIGTGSSYLTTNALLVVLEKVKNTTQFILLKMSLLT